MALLEVSFSSQCLGRTVPMTVILPTDKQPMPGQQPRPRDLPYKTLYLLHGVYGSCTDWLCGTRIRRWAEARDLAVVMPSGENSMYLDNPAAAFGKFIGRELVDFTRRTFPLSQKREDTYIGGLSMGGFGALRNGLKYHETFGAIIALSAVAMLDADILNPSETSTLPIDRMAVRRWHYGNDLMAALESDRNPACLVKKLAEEGAEFPAIYMACGESDFLLEKNKAFHALLQTCHVPHTFELGPGSHEWDFWDRYLLKALNWLPLEIAAEGRGSGNVL